MKFNTKNFSEIEELNKISIQWDEKIERQEIQLNYYSTSMIYVQNQEIVRNIGKIKYNNIFLDINVEDNENNIAIDSN